MRSFAVVGALSLVTGCAANFDETTFVRVRDPAQVGVADLLPPGGDEQKVEVPATTPPLTEGFKYATLERRKSGHIELECPTCKGPGAQHAAVVDETLVLRGGPDRNVHWRANSPWVDLRYSHEALFKCYRRRGDCPREAIGLWLQTPVENIVEIRHRKIVSTAYGERTGAKMGVIVGSLFFAAGAALITGLSIDQGKVAGLLPGAPFMGVGGFFALSGIRGLLAEDSETTIFRR